MPIDPEMEEVLNALIEAVDQRIAEVKAVAGTGNADAAKLAERLERVEKQLTAIQAQQTQINAFLTGMLKLMVAKRVISQQDMVDVYRAAR